MCLANVRWSYHSVRGVPSASSIPIQRLEENSLFSSQLSIARAFQHMSCLVRRSKLSIKSRINMKFF